MLDTPIVATWESRSERRAYARALDLHGLWVESVALRGKESRRRLGWVGSLHSGASLPIG